MFARRITLVALLLAVCLPAMAQERKSRSRKGDRVPDKLKSGDTAPDFALKSLDGKQTVKLSSFKGKKPVALVFGSYT